MENADWAGGLADLLLLRLGELLAQRGQVILQGAHLGRPRLLHALHVCPPLLLHALHLRQGQVALLPSLALVRLRLEQVPLEAAHRCLHIVLHPAHRQPATHCSVHKARPPFFQSPQQPWPPFTAAPHSSRVQMQGP